MASTPLRNVIEAAYVDHRRYVLGVLRKRCRWIAPSDCEAILHDAYLVLLEKHRNGTLDLSRMTTEQVRAYLTQTALHKGLDARKHASRTRTVALDDEEHALPARSRPVEEQALAVVELAAVRAMARDLPNRRRRVVELRYFLDRTPREIQYELGLSERVYRRELERGTRTLAAGLRSAA